MCWDGLHKILTIKNKLKSENRLGVDLMWDITPGSLWTKHMRNAFSSVSHSSGWSWAVSLCCGSTCCPAGVWWCHGGGGGVVASLHSHECPDPGFDIVLQGDACSWSRMISKELGCEWFFLHKAITLSHPEIFLLLLVFTDSTLNWQKRGRFSVTQRGTFCLLNCLFRAFFYL